MKCTAVSIAMLSLVGLVGGCASSKPKDEQASAPVGAMAEVSIPAATPVAATPAPEQPVIHDVPPATAAPAGFAAAPTAGRYTVQRGDTLWKIASTQYGDGKQWQRIAAANPGLAPETLKAGQTIVLP